MTITSIFMMQYFILVQFFVCVIISENVRKEKRQIGIQTKDL